MLNVLNSAPKINKKRKPKSESNKKVNDSSQLATPLSPPLKSESPLHSPSTLDLDSLSGLQSELSIADESLSFSEPSTLLTDYVPLSVENITESAISDPTEPLIKEDPVVEKPPQLKVYNKITKK